MITANILGNAIQRKIALKQILDEKEWSETLMQGMPQLNYVFDLQGRLKRWNKSLADLLECTNETQIRQELASYTILKIFTKYRTLYPTP